MAKVVRRASQLGRPNLRSEDLTSGTLPRSTNGDQVEGRVGLTNWVTIGPSGQVSFATQNNSALEITRSFKIHVRVVGHSDTEMILEGDILDNDS